MELSEQTWALADRVEEKIRPAFRRLERLADRNQAKVLAAFQRRKVSDFHFSASTGYGYNDTGREILDAVYADAFGAEAALVRPHFVSGTHTIATALFGVLRPGDHLLYVTGSPYDTLRKVIGGKGTGSLQEWGIAYDEAELAPDGSIDWKQVAAKLKPNTKMIGLQRSRGYAWRPSFTVGAIREAAGRVKELRDDLIVFCDNCYGEFCEELEPNEAGVDLIAGSLIKNPGGGIAPMGGYIAGRRDLVERCAHRLTAPGLGTEVGAMLESKRAMFQGLFLAPHFVSQALKGSVFAAALLEEQGFTTHPHWSEPRTDLIQAVRFQTDRQLIAFIQAIQRASPVDAHVVPEPWDMPGYDSPVIMAAGTFIQGGSLELSADAPVRPPYTAYMQGGLTYSHVKGAVLSAWEAMQKHNLL